MKCVNGVWYHRGQIYATLYEALAAVWPQALPRRVGEKRSRPRYYEYRERQGEKGFPRACFTSENTTGKEVLQG